MNVPFLVPKLATEAKNTTNIDWKYSSQNSQDTSMDVSTHDANLHPRARSLEYIKEGSNPTTSIDSVFYLEKSKLLAQMQDSGINLTPKEQQL